MWKHRRHLLMHCGRMSRPFHFGVAAPPGAASTGIDGYGNLLSFAAIIHCGLMLLLKITVEEGDDAVVLEELDALAVHGGIGGLLKFYRRKAA